MKTCIICRKEKEENKFNDEHVIPDSIGGYYHIYTVCIDCNSKLGSSIDNKLTNHKFIEFERHALGLKGKSGNIPNPFSGTHVLKNDPNQKVQLILDEDGNFIPKLLPNLPKELPTIGEEFSIIIDKKDTDKKDEIIDKFLSRHGIPREQVKFEWKSESAHSNISVRMVIETHKFKMGLLKIAYEFAVDKIPEYFNDPDAIKISQILLNADFEKMDTLLAMGNGLQKQILQPFEFLLNFQKDNHYLILFDSEEYGLLCFVNLFNSITLGFVMSQKKDYIEHSLLVLKNDISKKCIEFQTLAEIVSNTYSPVQYNFQYHIPDKISLLEFINNEASSGFSFYRELGQIPFFDSSEIIKYPNIEDKLQQSHLKTIDRGDFINEIKTEIYLDEELYIKLLPINKLYRVTSVKLTQSHKIKF